MSPSPAILTDVTVEGSADTTQERHRVQARYNTRGSSEIHLALWKPRLAVPELFNLSGCPASVFCIVQPGTWKRPHKTAHTYELGEAGCCSDECTGRFSGSGRTKSADDGPTFYFLYSKINLRALRHSRLKTPQTKSCTVRWNGEPLEKFLRDQQVHQRWSRLALRTWTSGGEMNKWIKPWVSRRQALAQTEARWEIPVYSTRKMEARGYVCAQQKEREGENGTKWEMQAKRPSSCQVTACSLMHTRTFIWGVGGHESKVQEHFLKAS